jgi:L-lactate dehydrogenase complex protein LldF
MSTLYGSSSIYNTATAMAPLANLIPAPLMNLKLNPWAEGHKMMSFPKESFHSMWKKGKVK